MPSTTRYSATFDRPYEEDERNLSNSTTPTMRRSRSQSWQANLGLDNRSSPRSSSTDSGTTKTPENIPTRTFSKPVVKSHNNPFQFVKINSSPLYKKAEEQLKKVKEVKKVETVKEEEEEWQSNLDSWKSRRRKMSEDVFRRQEEIRAIEIQEQQQSLETCVKKTKKFSEMVESRATRGRALSCCLISSPLELQEWDFQNSNSKNNGSHSYSEGSEENSAVNSEDEGIGVKRTVQKNLMNEKSQSAENILNDNSSSKSKFFELGRNGLSPNNGSYFDSGLESISSSHRAGDTPDSCSDFSQDSGSCIDCDSPRASGLVLNGVNLLEEFNAKDFLSTNNNLSDKQNETEASTPNNSNQETEECQKQAEKPSESLVLGCTNKDKVENKTSLNEKKASLTNGHKNTSSIKKLNQKQDRSIESENEVFVDDFEVLNGNINSSKLVDLKSKNKKKEKETKKLVSENYSNQKSNLSEDNLNVIFQSVTNKSDSEKCVSEKSDFKLKEQVILKDVPPVEQVAEEMERLILQQLEEEERAKELSSNINSEIVFDSPEHHVLFRSRSAEPPKEKPPPPPCTESESQKSTSLKRVDSTKRIKKEICKRRSNFLGIENDKNVVCDEFSIPPPPALEQILKAEMELDRENRKRFETATTERLILEENEIKKKEQEIIEIMETEERQKQLIASCDDYSDVKSDCTEVCDIIQEGDRIEILKEERKRMEKERRQSEEQRLRLNEEKQLREREGLIRKQEAADISSSAEISAPSFSGITNLFNTNIASLSSDTKLNVNGEGNKLSSKAVSERQIKSEDLHQSNISNKPTVPPKPLKKKEAIRKERERLRQEQEALVREREEHRRKLKEEEEMLKSRQKSHAPDVSMPRLGPLPSLIKTPYTPQLTSCSSAQLSTRENNSTNRSHYAAQNGLSSNNNYGEQASHSITSKRSKPIPPPKKTVKSELRNQQKVASVRKQSYEPLAESKYNQNHWLIQEAEMRRITELKERQRSSQFPNSQTHLAEDDVCSVPIQASVLPPSIHLNGPIQEKIWNQGHSNMTIKKYPPIVSSDKPVGIYNAQPPAKPSRVLPLEKQEQMLSVSGRKRCSHCNEELGRGAAMIIESLQLYYHIHCFQCCVCQAQLGNGSCGTDVRVRNNKLHCQNCYSNDEAGLKFSQV